MQDETGFVRHARLWFDLLIDLGALHIRGYREARVVHATAPGSLVRTPSFESLEGEALAFRYWFWGGVLSFIICGAVVFGLGHGGRHGSFPDLLFSANPVGNENAPSAIGSGEEKQRRNPTIEFTYEPQHPTEDSAVRLSAVVSAGNGPAPTGRVSFLYGWNVLEKGTLVHGSVTVYGTLPRGKKLPLSALYLGDINYYSARSTDTSLQPGSGSLR
jgi:hypothetical protein